VWDVSESFGVVYYTSTDWDGDGVLGGAMIDGPFPGFSANFNLAGSALPLVNNVPTITLNGSSTVNLQAGDIYIDAGATASDAEDGNLTASIVVSNPVDTSIAGTYIVSYNVTDSANTVVATRTVIVTQGSVPTITLNGAASVNAYIGEAYLDSGATAIDAEDGNITSFIVMTSNVDTSNVGVYTVTYTVTDSDANTSSVMRTVNVVIGDIPVITLLGSSSIIIFVGDTYVDNGATASDTEDGDITSSIIVVNLVNASVAGTYSITYNVSDSNGNLAIQVTRNVIVQPSSSNAEMCVLDTTGATVGCDATVNADIVFPGSGSTISSTTPFFGITWVAHDITTYLEGTYTIDTIEGGTYTFTVGPGQIGMHMLLDWGATTNIDIVVIWDVTTEIDGSLTLTSTDWDGDGVPGGAMIDGPFIGLSANFDIDSVFVALPVDNTPPEIHLVGESSVITYLGETFFDQSATAYDAEDGDLTSEIAVTSTVNSSVTGTYLVTYSVTDYDGYEVLVNRTVNVVEADADNDGVLYLNDNCTDFDNVNQRDTDADGFGNVCDGDLNNDKMINAVDLGLFKQRFFTSDPDTDFNGDGLVNSLDLGMFKQMYGRQPGPSGVL
jgi:hypothetical protein